jgi:hypothetical protein
MAGREVACPKRRRLGMKSVVWLAVGKIEFSRRFVMSVFGSAILAF